jgi:hypothetical protein
MADAPEFVCAPIGDKGADIEYGTILPTPPP